MKKGSHSHGRNPASKRPKYPSGGGGTGKHKASSPGKGKK